MSSSNINWAGLGLGFSVAGATFALRRYLMASSEKLQHKYSDEHREHYRNLFVDLNYKLMLACNTPEEVLYVNKCIEDTRIDTNNLVASIERVD